MSSFDFSRFTKKQFSSLSPKHVIRPSLAKFQERFNKFKRQLQTNNYFKKPLPRINRRVPELTTKLKKENMWLRDVVARKNIKTDMIFTDAGPPKLSLRDSVNQISSLFDKLEQELNDITLS